MSENEKHDPNDSSFSWEGIVGVLGDVITIQGQSHDGALALAELLKKYPELTEKIIERLPVYFREGQEEDGLIRFKNLNGWITICEALENADGSWFAYARHAAFFGTSEFLDEVGDNFSDYSAARDQCLKHLKALGFFRHHSDRLILDRLET